MTLLSRFGHTRARVTKMRLLLCGLMMVVLCSCGAHRKTSTTMTKLEAQKQAFAMGDRNGDGYISRQEWLADAQRVANRLPEGHRAQYMRDANKDFNKIDRDGDGKIDFNEFTSEETGNSN